MRLGYYQFDPEFGALEANREALEAAAERAEADLLVLPELATSGYLFNSPDEVTRLAESIPGPTTERLSAVARRRGIHLVVGLAEREGDAIYNSAALVGPAGWLGTYRKVHLFYEETLFFAPGNLGFPVFEVDGVQLGLLVCFDHLYPEAARSLALAGAQVVAHPSNLVLRGTAQLTTRVRALENRFYWALCNRHGTEERGGKSLTYTGRSQVIDPTGKVLCQAAEAQDALEVVEVDPVQALDKAITAYNDVLADRRPEVYRT